MGVVAEVVPLKQGLKLILDIEPSEIWLTVAEVVPLKQGLKLYCDIWTTSMSHSQVAEVVPLKQGLKPGSILQRGRPAPSCRGSSIKTRIETL